MTAVLPVRSLLAAILVMMAGSGFLSTLVSVRLETAGASAFVIGLTSTAYFAGLTIGALGVGRIIQRVGHIRAFTAFASLFSATTLGYALVRAPALWMGLRFVDGLCLAGVFICIESWLNERAEPATRGTILAAYMIALYLGQSIGQQLLNLDTHSFAIPFVIASVLVSLAAIPVALTHMPAPALGDSRTMGPRELHRVSPLGAVGVATSGLMLGAFYGLGAVFARRSGLSIADTAWFMTITILGGVALQLPLGRLSDRFDRRRVIVGVILGTLATTLCIALTGAGAHLFALAALFGGLSFALYPLCVAHTNDHLEPDQRMAASGGLVMVYSVGAAAGPMLGAGAMMAAGPAGLFLDMAAFAALALAVALWRVLRVAPVPEDQQQDYQVLARTTPMLAALDPVAEEPLGSGSSPG